MPSSRGTRDARDPSPQTRPRDPAPTRRDRHPKRVRDGGPRLRRGIRTTAPEDERAARRLLPRRPLAERARHRRARQLRHPRDETELRKRPRQRPRAHARGLHRPAHHLAPAHHRRRRDRGAAQLGSRRGRAVRGALTYAGGLQRRGAEAHHEPGIARDARDAVRMAGGHDRLVADAQHALVVGDAEGHEPVDHAQERRLVGADPQRRGRVADWRDRLEDQTHAFRGRLRSGCARPGHGFIVRHPAPPRRRGTSTRRVRATPARQRRPGAATLAPMLARHTKIVATLGPATDRPGVLDQLMAAGLDWARLNCPHGTRDDQRRRAREVRAAAERAGRPVALMFDLQGPKLRLSADTEQRMVEVGEAVTFAGAEVAPDPSRVGVDFEGFAELVTERSEIVIGDGVPRMTAERVEDGAVTTRVVSRGPLSPRKGITVTYARPTLPAITDKDIADLDVAVEMDADFVALSFVRSGADMQALRDLLDERGSEARTIAKVEKVEGYERLDEVIAAS